MQNCNKCIVFKDQPTQQLNKGESLFLEGADVNQTYLINSGVIKISKITENGNEHIIDLKVSGDKVALINLFEQHKTHHVSAIALTPCEVVVVDLPHFNNVSCDAKECILSSCFNTMLKRTSFRDSILFEEDVEKKILKLFDYLYELFGTNHNDQKVIELPFNRSELANIIGVRRETFSRKLSSLVKKKIVTLDKNKIIVHKM